MTPEQYARVKKIFVAVEDASPDEQPALLAKLCNGDDALREAVEKLLRHHDSEAAAREGGTLIQDRNLQTVIHQGAITAKMRLGDHTASERPNWLQRRRSRSAVLIVALLIAMTLAWFIDRQIGRQSLLWRQTRLQANAQETASMLHRWADQFRENGKHWGEEPELIELCRQLVELGADSDRDALRNSEYALQLRQFAADTFGSDARYVVWNRQGLTLASWQSDMADVGHPLPPEAMVELTRAFAGEPQLQFPTMIAHTTEGFEPEEPMNMWITFPVVAEDEEKAIAAMLVRDPSWLDDFQSMFDMQHAGDSADTFCLNADAYMLTRSRHADSWPTLGLAKPSSVESESASDWVRVVDPGGDLADGYRPERSRQTLPLTESAARVVAGESGYSLSPYRDVRGREVIGAWQWVPELNLGIVSELELREAYAFTRQMRTGLIAMFLLPAGLIGLYNYTQRQPHAWSPQDGIKEKRIGAYELMERVGEGGMGQVFRARHALLKRSSAIKILRPDRLTTVDVARFDREVKLAAQLTSPHTIRILDYGETEEGLIYFAMEYLDGLTMSSVVQRSGCLSAARTVHLLIQLCKSIEEAHTAGLIHRDIKPENIMVTRRGNEADWLILFDFGLAKSLEPDQREFRTRETIWAGTPMFMSPERVRTPAAVDPRMDIYAIGAVGYFMLTGEPPFMAADPEMVFEQILNVMPQPPSQLDDSQSIPELDDILLRCLAKSPDDRPDSALQLRKQLQSLTFDSPWTDDEANAWWNTNSRLR
ncbi:MAG: serine/threonine-protein kinase [Pirellulaceae bacterium]